MRPTVARKAFWRILPLAFIAVIAGPILTIINPGLFWDDWVWIFQDSAENIKVGRELGIWWAGYLTNAINALSQPVLTLRLVSWFSWGLTAFCVAFSLRRLRLLDRWETQILFLLVAATPIPMVRFLNSVAMYNVYIAAFWVGFAILVSNLWSTWRRWASVPFFLFSFYLNSLLLLYGAVLLFLFYQSMLRLIGSESLPFPWLHKFSCRFSTPTGQGFKSALHKVQSAIVYFLVRNWFFILLPVVFFLATTLFRARSPFYSGYNAVRPRGAVFGLIESIIALPRLCIGYIGVPLTTVSPILTIVFAFALVFLVRLLPGRNAVPSRRATLITAVAGGIILWLGSLPFFVVGKPPLLSDYYEARHILTSVPGIVLLEIAIVQALTLLGCRWWQWLALSLRDVTISCLISVSVLFSVASGLALLKDWALSESIEGYLRSHSADLKQFGTVIFEDQTKGVRIGDRYIWNYEYTGEIIKATGSKGTLGISLGEYRDWPKDVLLITDDAYRKRYNLDGYDFHKPHLVLTIRDAGIDFHSDELVGAALKHWRHFPSDLSRHFTFLAAYEYVEADRQMALMERVVGALEAYKRDHGSYPNSLSNAPLRRSGKLTIPPLVVGTPAPLRNTGSQAELVHKIESLLDRAPPPHASAPPPGAAKGDIFNGALPQNAESRTVADTWFDAIAPAYIPHNSLDADCMPNFCGLLYVSNGQDFKLVYTEPQDMPYARQAYGMNIDPVRTAYGFWTAAAATW